MEDLDDFKISHTNIGLPTTGTLKQLPRQSISSTLSAFFKPKVVAGQNMLASLLGPNAVLNPEEISVKEQKSFQGQCSSSNSCSQTSHEGSSESIEDIAKTLDTLQVWRDIEELVRLKTFNRITNLVPSKELFFSFLIQCCTMESFPEKFAPALAATYKWLQINNVPISKAITDKYITFFGKYKPHKSHKIEDLRILFKFCRAIQAPVEWIMHIKDPQFLMAETAVLTGCCTIARLLFECKKHYSHEYFALIDYIMEQSRLTAPSVDGFVKMIKVGVLIIDHAWKDTFQRYASTENTYTKSKTMKIGGQILGVLTRPIACSLVMEIVELAITLNKCEDIKAVLKSNLPFSNIQEFKELLNLQSQKEELKQIIAKGQQEEVAKKELKLKQQEEEKKQLENANELEFQQLQQLEQEKQQALFGIYHELCTSNYTVTSDKAFLEFVEQITTIAFDLIPSKILRAEQFAIMYLLITSHKQATLIQLATGFGKSLMLALMAQWINIFHNKKVIIIVPSAFLHAYQQFFYCPYASKIQEKITDPTAKSIFYCSYDRFNSPEFQMPADTVVLVDEFHEFFFNQPVAIANGKLVSIILKLKAADKLIGVSATFRGEAGIYKINTIMGAQFLKTPAEIKDIDLHLQIFGEVSDIPVQAVQLANEKAKTMPVIIFCNNPQQYKQLIYEAKMFVGEEVGELLSILKGLQKSSNAIVITTSNDSKGVDFLFALPQAYVIHTVLPKSVVQLKQDSGRGVRSSNFPCIGAIFTEKSYSSIEDVELGLGFAEGFEQMYPADYLRSLALLQNCHPKTAPQHKILKEAVDLLNTGAAFSAINDCLYKAAGFRTTLSKLQQQDFKTPAPKQGGFGMLGKRGDSENSIAGPTKKSGPMDKFFQSKKQKLNPEEDKMDLQQIRDSTLFNACSQSQFGDEVNDYMITEKNAELIQEQSSLMKQQPAAGNLNPAALEEKELEEARAVFEKHGIQIPGAPIANSRASSAILFGEEQQLKAGGKKRVEKTKEKAESILGSGALKSVASSKYKNYNKYIKCDLCKKEMRDDALKNHRGSRFCKKE